jgi:tRNA pseudouridine38-40 synthase
MRYLATISYDGSNFEGYQIQKKGRTIQGEIQKALTLINSNKEVSIHASGRTDAKVHALKQKIHFDLEKKIDEEELRHSLNNLLPEDIYVREIEEVKDTFHARYDVKAKEYIYVINLGEYDPIKQKYVFQYNKKLDVSEIERALKYLEGTHNFKSFSKSDEKDDYERTIIETKIIRDVKNLDLITISFLGTGFLRYMVRNMVGTLIEIGEGKRKSEDIITIIKSEDRTKAGPTARPEGLYLKDVLY